MAEFRPPIAERATEKLIQIVYEGIDHWQHEAIDQAKKELIKRNISQEEQNNVVEKWERELDEYLQEQAIVFEQNEFESYTKLRMLYIFSVAPFILVGKWSVGKDLFELRNENFKLKFKQRLILLIFGTLCWIGVISYTVKSSEEKRLKLTPKEEVELSKWMEKHGYE